MQNISNEISRGAYRELKGHYLKSFFLCLLCLPFFVFLAFIKLYFPVAPTLLGLFSEAALLIFPLCLIFRWHYKKIENIPPQKKLRFLLKSLLLIFYMQIALIFWLALFLLPAAVLRLSAAFLNADIFFVNDNRLSFILEFLSLSVLGALLPLYFLFSARFFLVFPLFFEDPQKKLWDILSLSIEKTKGERANIFIFLLKRLLELIPCMLIFPAVYFLPKIFFSISLYSKYLVEKNTPE